MRFNKNKKGFSLLELLLVMGIASCMTISMFIVFPKVQQAHQREQAEKEGTYYSSNNAQQNDEQQYSADVQDILHIQEAVKTYFKSSPSYAELDRLNRSDIFKDNFNYRTNNFNGDIVISSSDRGPAGTAGSAFSITYKNVPKDNCVEILQNASDKFYMVDVNNNPLTTKNTCSRDYNTLTFISL